MPQDVNSLIDRLCELFPALFNREAPKPLKIGLGPELINLAGGAHPALVDVTDLQMRQALTVYVEAPAYQQALVAGGPRYDLDGQPSGVVKPAQQARAALPPEQRPRKNKSAKKKSKGGVAATVSPAELTALLPEIIAMAIPGKLDVTLKINQLPQAKPTSAQTMVFVVQAEGRMVVVELKNKAWKNLATAAANYPQWVAAITGQLGAALEGGFRLDNPSVQVFEKKAKPDATAPAAPKPEVTAPVSEPATPATPTAPAPEPSVLIGRPKRSLKGR
jgi:sRNA-binding protein